MYGSGGLYKGQWLNDLRHGSGLLESKDGNTYEGTFVHDKVR